MSIYVPVVSEHGCPVIVPCFTWGVSHYLMTAYPFVTGIKSVSVLQFLMKTTSAKFSILDSGIYSLIKDTHQGKDVTPATLEAYTDKYIDLVKRSKWKGAIIEVDSHIIFPDDLKLLARLRKKFDDAGLSEQTMFAWHVPEGIDGLVKLLESRDRVAVAPREMFLFSKKDNTVFKRLVTRYRKQFSRCHVHCLGTNRMGVQDMPDNFSFDTTSWASIAMYGLTDAGYNTMLFRGKNRIVQPHIYEEVMSHMDDMLNIYRGHPDFVQGNKIRRNYLTMMSCGLRSTVMHYDSVRLKTPGSDMSIIDPLDYAKRNR